MSQSVSNLMLDSLSQANFHIKCINLTSLSALYATNATSLIPNFEFSLYSCLGQIILCVFEKKPLQYSVFPCNCYNEAQSIQYIIYKLVSFITVSTINTTSLHTGYVTE